jgi:hydrogenase-1 operon protein HyaF
VSSLDAIGVRVEGPSPETLARDNAWPILHEVRHAVDRLLQTGEGTVIDLRSLPFGATDLEYLLSELGTGELECRLEAFGKSLIRETAYPGVWVVEHFNVADNPIGRFIEVTYVPSILKSDPTDVRSALDRLTERLAAQAGDPPAGAPASP